MNAKTRFALAVAVLGLLMTGPFLLTVGILWVDLGAEERAGFLVAMDRWLPVGGLVTIMTLILGLQLLRALFQQYVHGLLRMAETLRLMLGANRNFRVAPEGPPEVRDLARAANDLAQQRNELLDDVEAQIRVAKATVEEEKNRLAALMSELALGVVVKTIRPEPCAFMCGQAACATVQLPATCTASSDCRSSRESSSNAPSRMVPALAITASIRPKADRPAAMMARPPSLVVTLS